VLVHEYPVEGAEHPVTVPSTAHEDGMVTVTVGVLTLAVAVQPPPASKSEKSPRTTNQEFRMGLRVPVLRHERIYSDGPPIFGDRRERPGLFAQFAPISRGRSGLNVCSDPTMPPA